MNNCIYTTIDRNYENYATACFNSMEKNYPAHPIVLIYYDDLSDAFKSYIATLNNFKLIKIVQDEFKSFNHGIVNKSIVYNRYNLWTSAFDEYDVILHLDVDTLVLGSLDVVFVQDEFLMFDNNEILPDVYIFPTTEEAQESIKRVCPSIEYDVNHPPKFGNAGIFTIPKRYRTVENHTRLLAITNELSSYLIYADQSAINLWMLEKSIEVSNEVVYNFQPHFFNCDDNTKNLEDVKIIHFAAKKADHIQFSMWWRMKNIGTDFYMLYNRYLENK